MTEQQQAFINAYVSNGFNATKAARVAGYAHPNKHAWRVKSDPEVAAEIEARMAEHGMSANEVLARLSKIARGDLADFFDFPEGLNTPVLNIRKAKKARKTGLLKSYAPTKHGVKIEIHDPQSALVNLGRHHKLWTDRNEHSGEVGIVERAVDTLRQKLVPATDEATAGSVS